MPGSTKTNTSGAAAGATAQSAQPHPAATSNTTGQPANTDATTTNPGVNTPSRPSSPQRPPYSPITPPQKPVAFPPHPHYTHATHQDQIAIPPPQPETIDFENNPDAIALRSAISILLIQRRKAEADMAALQQAKKAALAEPDAFVQDLMGGQIHVEGEGLFISGARSSDGRGSGEREGSDSDSDSSDSDSEPGEATVQDGDGTAAPTQATSQTLVGTGIGSANTSSSIATTALQTQNMPAGPGSGGEEVATTTATNPGPDTPNTPNTQQQQARRREQTTTQPKPWANLPKPQTVVRCPPINWSQYAVVGDSLDKLHDEQLRAPTQGTPAIMTRGGRPEFRGGLGKRERLVGVGAPYAPGKDKIDRRAKRGKP